jgi:hypothetical protein
MDADYRDSPVPRRGEQVTLPKVNVACNFSNPPRGSEIPPNYRKQLAYSSV